MADSTDWVFEHHLPCYESQKICIDDDGNKIKVTNQIRILNNIHANVECDSCHMVPIVGFRYKCIECRNYDLCQNCEAKNVHYFHMMVRMPHNECRYEVDAWVSGGGFGRGPIAAAAMGPTRNGEATNDSTATGGAGATGEIEAEIVAKAAAHAAAAAHSAAAAHAAAESTQEIAAKVSEIAAANAKTMEENVASTTEQTKAAEPATAEKDRPSTAATNVPLTQPQQPQTVPVLPSPSLESLAQFLDPQYMKTGIQILNNFSDMFAKMLDLMDGAEGGDSSPSSSFCPLDPNARKNSFASTQSNNSQKSNNSSKSTDLPNESKQNENSVTKEAEAVQSAADAKKQDSTSSLVEISDLFSDSETDSFSDRFIKLKKQWERAVHAAKTPPFLNKSNVMDFAQMCADLKAIIAQEEQWSANSPAKVAQESNTTTSDAVPDEPRAVPVFNNTNTTNVQTNKPEEQRPVPIYHSDERINSAVHSMMSMGFSNEGAWLTQLLDNVNGNISEALDLISATQREAR